MKFVYDYVLQLGSRSSRDRALENVGRFWQQVLALLVLTGLLSPDNLVAQALDSQFLRSTVLISFRVDQDRQSSGSGFLVFRETNPNEGHIFLVTNRHVLPEAGSERAITIRVNVQDSDSTRVTHIEVPVVGANGRYLPAVRFHPTQGFDVAAVNITETVVREGIQGRWIPASLFATNERLRNENITVGDEIFILGYPDAIFDARNAFPILRTGVIATVPTEGYAFNERLRQCFGLPQSIDGFLIDANVFPGSSGSVVILKQQASLIGPGGGTLISNAKKIPYILGIVSGSIPIEDAALHSVQRMGLGVVYSAKAILETIELFYQ